MYCTLPQKNKVSYFLTIKRCILQASLQIFASCPIERVEGNITVPPLPSETVLASFPAHGYSMCFHFVNMGLQAAIIGSFIIVAMTM